MEMPEELSVSVGTIQERLFLERLRLVQPEKAVKVQAMKVKARAKFIKDNWTKLYPSPDQALMKVITGPLQKLVMKGMGVEADEVIRGHLEPLIKAKMHNTNEFYIIMMRYSSNIKDRSPEELSRLLLNYYLLSVEGVFTAQVNLIAYLLANAGAEYRSSKSSNENAPAHGSLGVIEEDSLWNKLRFLEDNGFSFVVEACDRQLRNSVAHLDFIVFTNGCVGYGTNQKKPRIIKYDELLNKVEVLKSISEALNAVLVEETTAWRKKTKGKRAISSKTVLDAKDPKEILRKAGDSRQKAKHEEDGGIRL